MLAFAKDNQEPQPKVARAGPAGEPTGGLPAQGLSLLALAKQCLLHATPSPFPAPQASEQRTACPRWGDGAGTTHLRGAFTSPAGTSGQLGASHTSASMAHLSQLHSPKDLQEDEGKTDT